ncbi:Leucine--tRNA ligase, cytoplasmic [Glycine soja]|uniref:Leucine--tRNA ligase, cytoplasmic n=1 Tax=Glycine soja TaxID=3848 RepID=A0A445GGE6_GLYSO|nr:Leucine--tRNA ligase, cytoplasmic [Glycine soja]
MAFLGETSSQTIVNSTLGFIFPNGSIVHNDSDVCFQASTPVPIRIPNGCDFEVLKTKIHNTLKLTDNQFLDEIYYRKPFTYADGILNLLQATMTPTHDALLYYNGRWNMSRQNEFVGYSFTGKNPKKFDIPFGCTMDELKDLIKQVAPHEITPYGIHETQTSCLHFQTSAPDSFRHLSDMASEGGNKSFTRRDRLLLLINSKVKSQRLLLLRYTIFSPLDGQPRVDHDRASGEGVQPQEYTIIKMELIAPFPEKFKVLEGKKVFLVTATLTAETMYGQTNAWVLPDGKYGAFEINDSEVLVLAHRATLNLAYQNCSRIPEKPSCLLELTGRDLIGLPLKSPLSFSEVIYVLPMLSILMDKGTGVVTSVPSDWLRLYFGK